MTKKPRTETRFIVIHQTLEASLIKDTYTYIMIVAVIGTGVWLESSAMQWCGFLMLSLGVLGKIISKTKKNFSFEEAKEYLTKTNWNNIPGDDSTETKE